MKKSIKKKIILATSVIALGTGLIGRYFIENTSHNIDPQKIVEEEPIKLIQYDKEFVNSYRSTISDTEKEVTKESLPLEHVVKYTDLCIKYGFDDYNKLNAMVTSNIDWETNMIRLHKGRKLYNFGEEQNFLRILVGLSEITGNKKYKELAKNIVISSLNTLQREESGLLCWGGHMAYDMEKDEMYGRTHELKYFFPFYELMFEVDEERTELVINAFWEAHIKYWDRLDFTRHGIEGLAIEFKREDIWKRKFTGKKVPFNGSYTFMNTGSDLFYSAAVLSKLTGKQDYLTWAKRLASRYVEGRNKNTGLGGHQFTLFGNQDRGIEQFGQEFGDKITEFTLVDFYGRYSTVAIVQMRLEEIIGGDGRDFCKWGLEDLKAWGNRLYSPKTNEYYAALIDGTILSKEDCKRDGYFGTEIFTPRKIHPTHFYAFSLGYKKSKEKFYLDIAENMGRFLKESNAENENNIFGYIELFKATGNTKYIEEARRISQKYLNMGGKFPNSRIALAILHLYHLNDEIPFDVVSTGTFEYI